MKQKKKLKELTIKDNFMFGAVMSDEENCRRLLELTLGFPIERVIVSREKSIVYHPEYKGVRLDIYARDGGNTHYNVEMQVAKKPKLGRRSRYYHSQLDMELLLSGEDYTELPDTYVIFICDFDPFGKGRYCYTFENRCLEEDKLELEEGCRSIFLSTHGKNREGISEELVRFLEFVKADLDESKDDFEDAFVDRLQRSVEEIKGSREMEERFMILEEMLREERMEGKAEGRAEGKAEGKAEGQAEYILEVLENLGPVPEEQHDKIMEEHDLTVLKKWFLAAVKADSIEQFLKSMQ